MINFSSLNPLIPLSSFILLLLYILLYICYKPPMLLFCFSMLSFKEIKKRKKCRSLYLPIYVPYAVYLMSSDRSKFPSGIILLNLEIYLFMYLFACFFRISCSAGLLLKTFLSFCLSENVFVLF